MRGNWNARSPGRSEKGQNRVRKLFGSFAKCEQPPDSHLNTGSRGGQHLPHFVHKLSQRRFWTRWKQTRPSTDKRTNKTRGIHVTEERPALKRERGNVP